LEVISPFRTNDLKQQFVRKANNKRKQSVVVLSHAGGTTLDVCAPLQTLSSSNQNIRPSQMSTQNLTALPMIDSVVVENDAQCKLTKLFVSLCVVVSVLSNGYLSSKTLCSSN
jgi:esterase/lipase superfamily enzyme